MVEVVAVEAVESVEATPFFCFSRVFSVVFVIGIAVDASASVVASSNASGEIRKLSFVLLDGDDILCCMRIWYVAQWQPS